MNEQQFWTELQQLIYQSAEILHSKEVEPDSTRTLTEPGYEKTEAEPRLVSTISESGNKSEILQSQWEKLVQIAANVPLPTKLIIQTICHGSVYLTERSLLNIPAITPTVTLNANQQLALEMALSNSAISLISGSPGTGKTRIATTLADAAISHQKRVLILTHHPAALTNYRNLPGYPFLLSQQQDYRNWLIEQLRYRHLAQPQMDFLPLHLLPDVELAKLRTSVKLETWLPIIQNASLSQLTERLHQAFPSLSTARLQLFAHRLKQLEPLLQQQLRLSQLYGKLSEQAVTELADKLIENPQIPILGTVDELMQAHQSLWQNTFDLVIVEEAQYLSWIELMLLSGLGKKLVLFGDYHTIHKRNYPAAQQTFFTRFPQCFNWLAKNLLPAFVVHLSEQFRLHSEIATPVYRGISNRWILSQRVRSDYHLTQLRHRLVWQDVPSQTASEQILKFIQNLDPQLSSQIGIITFCTQQRDWLQSHLTPFADILIGTVAEWAGIERAIAIICCVGNLDIITPEYINIALTRGQEYLILFGNYDYWWQSNSPLRALLAQPELHKERTVVMS